MNNQEALAYIRAYFDELFVKRNMAALDEYLDQDYFDDDIGDPNVDHIENGKAFLTQLFKDKPTIGVDVKSALAEENVISAFLDWFILDEGVKKIIIKGVAIFVLKNQKIMKRHTFIYFKE